MKHRIPGAQKCGIMSAIVTILFLLCSGACAQVQWEIDAVLDGLSGAWSGNVTSEAGTHPCEKRYVWILNNSYLHGTMTRFSGSGTSDATPFEEREYLKPSGENRYSVNRFDNTGISSWGTIDVLGKSWTISLKNSDGGSETALLKWIDAYTITIEGTIVDPAGTSRKNYFFTLKKKRE